MYTKILKQLYPYVPVVLGGIEASLRRLTHYDYWQDSLRRCILCDSGADLIVYGMGERPIVEICRQLEGGTRLTSCAPSPRPSISVVRAISPEG